MNKIKNLYINRFKNGGVVVHDMRADQELLRKNNIKFKNTYEIKDDLKKLNFKFRKNREWVLFGLTFEEEKKMIKELREKFLVEKESYEIDYKKTCMICGGYFLTICECEMDM